MSVKKRLHVSGLTPSITADDINARLRGFGNVIALDGFGLLDAVGQPRKFAYVTIEATEPNLARCLNVLSGTTWKGARLRLGEAKPDYIERLDVERRRAAESVEDRPSRRRRLPRGVHGVRSKDMSCVDLQNVHRHRGWNKTALSHLVRPMKMRPSHPLPAPALKATGKHLSLNLTKVQSSRPTRSAPPTRARVRLIDPRLYNPVHLREDMLDSIVIEPQAAKRAQSHSHPYHPVGSDDEDDALPAPISDRDIAVGASAVMPDFAEQKRRDLGILTDMFGDGASDWGGKESVASEVVTIIQDANSHENVEGNYLSENSKIVQPGVINVRPLAKEFQSRSLKDMFKPHEEEAAFSLLPGIGELDIDPDFDFDFATPTVSIDPVRTLVPQGATHTSSSSTAALTTLNPTLLFFFPQPGNSRVKDLFTMAHAEGWKFGRTGDTDTIRQRWDAAKGPLTREWKRRSREATKARKRWYGNARGEVT